MTRPHLKLHVDGSLSLVRKASASTTNSGREIIKARYGSVTRFARTFNLPYGVVCQATQPSMERFNIRRAGAIAQIRQILGLRSEPSERSKKAVATYADRSGRIRKLGGTKA